MDDKRLIVWAVVVSNYEPAEVLALFETEVVAEQAAKDWGSGGRDLRVQQWQVSRTVEEAGDV